MRYVSLCLLIAVASVCGVCQAADATWKTVPTAPIVMPLRADAAGVVWLPTVGLGLIRRPDSSAFSGVILFRADNDMTRAYERMGKDIDPALRIDPGLGALGLRLGDRYDAGKLPAHLRVPDDAPPGGNWLVRKDGGLVTLTLRNGRIESITVYGPFMLNNGLVAELGSGDHSHGDGHGHDHADGSSCCELSKLTPAPPQTDALPRRSAILNPVAEAPRALTHPLDNEPDPSVIRWPLIALLAGLLIGGLAGFRQMKRG